MRDIISKFLTDKATADKNVHVFSGDHGYALFDELRKKAPDQFINAGVSEQAMVGYAAGMAKEGMIPFVYGLSAFIPVRVLEFIKMDVCYESLPVIFLGDGAGLVYATLGPSHQCAEDIACVRTLPHMTIFSPADSYEMLACLEYAYTLKSPSYIRIGKADKTVIHSKKLDSLELDVLSVKETNSNVCIIATGSMMDVGMKLSQKYNLSLYSAPVIHPLDRDKIIGRIQKYKTVISLEEHSIVGGLGSVLSEFIAESETPSPIRLIRFGIRNRFTERCGSYDYAIKEHGLDYATIEEKLIKEKILG
ncbi:1-deoxy-D-xylulose-5-phosphate synthase [Leptospira kobayashii]|uniref:1-deoxy-D-xylulose-5-phosphate synthase n=1 Tax=Leptospira kobayashii TaxID=1917830 RepID=A0ABM7URU1_9LEPT|nr:transketolase C-terminal domain-containing protein [Leptospira kobayashii]BDA79170.1 1-deoxy-D-xylulose-5-phosphate synthase [Leptospira kobayashii]